VDPLTCKRGLPGFFEQTERSHFLDDDRSSSRQWPMRAHELEAELAPVERNAEIDDNDTIVAVLDQRAHMKQDARFSVPPRSQRKTEYWSASPELFMALCTARSRVELRMSYAPRYRRRPMSARGEGGVVGDLGHQMSGQ